MSRFLLIAFTVALLTGCGGPKPVQFVPGEGVDQLQADIDLVDCMQLAREKVPYSDARIPIPPQRSRGSNTSAGGFTQGLASSLDAFALAQAVEIRKLREERQFILTTCMRHRGHTVVDR